GPAAPGPRRRAGRPGRLPEPGRGAAMSPDDLNCDEFVELVTAYLDNTLDDLTRRRFEAHLDDCEGCERYLDQIRRTVTELGQLPVERLSDDARDGLLAAFRGWHSDRS